MTDAKLDPEVSPEPGAHELEAGGLRFSASFRGESGATLRVNGTVAGAETEMLRFDDFIDSPHYHAPSAGPSIAFDRATLGEPLDWIITQLRDHLPELLSTAGYGDVLPTLDPRVVTDSAEKIRALMVDAVPDGYVRVPGVGLQRAGV